MGYGEPSASQLATAQYYADGYPACGQVDSPRNCADRTAYGQTTPGIGTSARYPDNSDNNFKTFFFTDLDVSPGMSGAPFYRSDNILQGIIVNQHCDVCSSATNYPNGVRSMTPWLHGFISSQRAAYP
jgi:hypothetical protein